MKPWLCVLAVFTWAEAAAAQQGSIELKNSSSELCHRNITSWSISSSGVIEDGWVVWTVVVTRGPTSDDLLLVNGCLRVRNNGAGPATIGNIVVNLQRKSGKDWITVSSAIADATSGDAATTALVVKGASSERLSSFSENAASGGLNLTDSDGNTIFALVPQYTVPPETTVDLLYTATFNNAILQIPAGELVRSEAIVTFGNAGLRGGSGASAQNVDINGNGQIDADEDCVRSVPSRITRAVPEVEKCNDSVTLSASVDHIAVTGTVIFGDFLTDIADGAEVLSDSAVRTIAVSLDNGVDGGTITSTVYLDAEGESVTVVGPLDPLTGLPLYEYEFPCCPELSLLASSTLDVEGDPVAVPIVTFGQGDWGAKPNNGNEAALMLAAEFGSRYPSGLKVGIGFSMTFTSAAAVEAYLPAGGPPRRLTSSLVNPTTSASGAFGGQVLSLRLNVDFNAGSGYADLVLKSTGTSLDGKTVAQILEAAETVLGGGALPAGFTVPTLHALVASLNDAFLDAEPSDWAVAHLQF